MNKGKRTLRIRGLYDLSGNRIELLTAQAENGWQILYLGEEGKEHILSSDGNKTADSIQLLRASGGILSPAFVDLLSYPDRLRTAPALQKEMASAAKGGFGTLLDVDAPLPSHSGYESWKKRTASFTGKSDSSAPPALLPAMPLPSTAEEAEMAKASGAYIFTDRMSPEADSARLYHQMSLAAKAGIGVMLSPLCPGWEGALSGQAASYFRLPSVPDAAEALAVSRGLILAQSTGCALHFPCLTCGESLALIRQAKERGLPVTCGVTPFHIALDAQDVFLSGTAAKIRPPLSSPANREALIEGICDRTVDCISSLHVPLKDWEKADTMEKAAFGAPMYQTAFGICHTVLVRSGLISISRLIALLSTNPGRILGLDTTLRQGQTTRFCILSPAGEWVVGERMQDSERHSPFIGRTLRGTVSHSFCL